jgi:ParB-like chromosome segregation protein Spo0J
MQRETINAESIIVTGSRRLVNDEAVEQIAASVKKIGLQHPITIRYVEEYVTEDGQVINGAPILIAGRHRLEAIKRLGISEIDCNIEDWDEDTARMWEIAENLHRAELTALERDEQIAEWVRLANKPKEGVLVQNEPKPRNGRPEAGVRKATRELGIDRNEAVRAEKVVSLPAEAKEAARELGFDDNQSVLLKAAKDKDTSVAFLRAEHARREAERQRKEAEKANKDTDRVIEMTNEEEYAEWLKAHPDFNLPRLVSWIEGTKQKGVIAALRRKDA